MTEEELTELLNTLRHARTDLTGIEAKRAQGGVPANLVETLSAFSNSPGGGVILLGLDEQAGFTAVGIPDPPTVQSKVQGLCADSMEPPLRPLIGLHRVEDRQILVIEVPELPLDQKPCFYKGSGPERGSYVRVGDGDYRMTPYEVSRMIASRGQPRDDVAPVVDAHPDDLDPSAVAGLLARVRATRPTFASDDDVTALRRLRMLVPHPTNDADLVPSVAGLLCLGRHPQDFFPQLTITFAHYPGLDADPGLRFLDSRTFEGPLAVMVRDALTAIRANMSRPARMVGAGRTDTWEYPEQALREAVVNAVAHRDYSPQALGAQVQIEMYADRLVIRSPGGLHGPVTAERLGEPGVSSSRNETLMRVLDEIQIPGEQGALCENRGSGIPLMAQALREAGLPLPTFEDKLSSFEVSFANHTLLDEPALQWLTQLRQDGLSPSQAEALLAMRGGTTFTNSTYRQRFLLDSRVATTELGDLVRRGLVRSTGSRRWTTYDIDPSLTGTGDPAAAVLATDGPRRTLQALADGAEWSKARIAGELGENDRTVLAWLDALRRSSPVLVERIGAVRSPRTTYRITQSGRDALAGLSPSSPRLFD